jgi:hypothetical protein
MEEGHGIDTGGDSYQGTIDAFAWSDIDVS